MIFFKVIKYDQSIQFSFLKSYFCPEETHFQCFLYIFTPKFFRLYMVKTVIYIYQIKTFMKTIFVCIRNFKNALLLEYSPVLKLLLLADLFQKTQPKIFHISSFGCYFSLLQKHVFIYDLLCPNIRSFLCPSTDKTHLLSTTQA